MYNNMLNLQRAKPISSSVPYSEFPLSLSYSCSPLADVNIQNPIEVSVVGVEFDITAVCDNVTMEYGDRIHLQFSHPSNEFVDVVEGHGEFVSHSAEVIITDEGIL